MWTQYRKTFWPMQAMILVVALVIYFGMDRLFSRAAIFWAIIQIGAVIGAAWAARLKKVILANSNRLPLHKRA